MGPSAITNLKSYNMRRINRNAPKKVIKIECTDKNEAEKLEKKILKYIAKIAPKIECASIGYATKRMDVTKRMREIVDLRDLSVIQKIGGSDIVKHLHGDAALK